MSCLHLETTSSPKPRRLQKPRRQLQCFFGVGRRFTEGLTGLVFPRRKPPCTFFFLMPPAIISALTCHCFSFLYLLASAVHPSIHLCIHHSTLQRGLMTDWWSPAGLLPNRGPFTLVKPSCQLPECGLWRGYRLGRTAGGDELGLQTPPSRVLHKSRQILHHDSLSVLQQTLSLVPVLSDTPLRFSYLIAQCNS